MGPSSRVSSGAGIVPSEAAQLGVDDVGKYPYLAIGRCSRYNLCRVMKRPMSDVDPEICNCGALRQAARRVTKLYDDALAPVGLGVNQFSILVRLGLVGPSTIKNLARLLVMDRSTLGHLLRPLEKRGLVTLEVSDQDGRSRTIALTQAGKAAVAKARPRWAAAQRRFESTFGKEAAHELRAVLKEIATAEFG
jgi:DNA-binding MarR family transcriptional regulator